MSHIEEKRYYIDPGIGEKRYTCPYSCYEDGRDAKEDIIPPKGYILKGFKFNPHTSNKYYDGKLIAEYEKAPFFSRMRQSWWRFPIYLFILAALTAFLYFIIFSKPKPTKAPQTHTRVIIDTLPADTSFTKPDTLKVHPDSLTNIIEEPIAKEPTAQQEPTIQTESIAQEEPIVQQKEEKEVVEHKIETPTPAQTQQVEVQDNGPSAQFKQKFWKMIHNQNGQMDDYSKLFEQYRGKAKGKEIDYLRGTILKNTSGFKEWRNKLRKIPADELQSINTIDDLKNQLK